MAGLIELIIVIVIIAAMWKMFAKASQPGWAAVIPIYNVYILLKVAQKPGWWLILMFIPVVNIIVAFIVCLAVAENFGKGVGFAVGLFFLALYLSPSLHLAMQNTLQLPLPKHKTAFNSQLPLHTLVRREQQP